MDWCPPSQPTKRSGGALSAPPVGSANCIFGIFEAHRTAHEKSQFFFRKRPLDRLGGMSTGQSSWLSPWVSNIFGHNCLQTEKFKVTLQYLFLARDVIYASRAYAMMSVSVCDGSALWSRCMPGRGEGSSRAMLATARPSCSFSIKISIFILPHRLHCGSATRNANKITSR